MLETILALWALYLAALFVVLFVSLVWFSIKDKLNP